MIAVGHLWTSLRRYPALLLLIAVYAASCLVVAANVYRGAGGVQQTKVLRLALHGGRGSRVPGIQR